MQTFDHKHNIAPSDKKEDYVPKGYVLKGVDAEDQIAAGAPVADAISRGDVECLRLSLGGK
jgi:hypothetical protein